MARRMRRMNRRMTRQRYSKPAFKRGLKRRTGLNLKRNILSQVIKRKIELSAPVYLKSTAQAALNGYVSNYSLEAANINGCLDLAVDFSASSAVTRSYAPEIIRLARSYSHYKVTGISIKYNRSISSLNAGVQNYGPMNVFPLITFNTTDDTITLANNYSYDNSLRIPANASASKAKFWKFPQMSIYPGKNEDNIQQLPSNAWIPMNTATALHLALGQPSSNPDGSYTHNLNTNANSTILIGTFTYTIYVQFAIPRSSA